MIQKKSWNEFRKTGLFLLMNQFLHIFGWAIVAEIDKESGEVKEVYPARVKYRGFSNANTAEAYQKVSTYMKENAAELEEEANS